MRIEATYDLVIELIPGDGEDEPALLLWSKSNEGDDDEQGIIIMLDEVEELRAALAEAAAKLAGLGSRGIK